MTAITLGACNAPAPAPSTPESPDPSLVGTAAASLEATGTLPATVAQDTPTATRLPLVAQVNATPITVAEWEAEAARLQAALGRELSAEEKTQALDELVNEILLAEGAAKAGFVLDEAALDQRIQTLSANLAGEEALASWMSAQGFTQETFRSRLSRSVSAAWMRDQITAAVPAAAEQVHARQILLYNLEDANDIQLQLQGGADFATLASQVDATLGGDLGWFPAGTLLDPALEAAVFALQPGQYTQVTETAAGFHIVQVIEREPQRALDAVARLHLQAKAVQDWLAEQRSQSQIQVWLP